MNQVDKSHYEFSIYLNKQRWASVWHQLDEVIKLDPNSILEIGPGPGVFKAVARVFDIHVETLDIDPKLKPDHIASVFNLPFEDGRFDVVCAFQMLEHLPFENSLKAFGEICRVAKKDIVISLPDAETKYLCEIQLPMGKTLTFNIPKPTIGLKPHVFA